MRLPLRPLLTVVLLALLWRPAAPAMAQVRRCVTATGETLFTDRKCADLGASERVPQASNTPARVYRGGCARSLQDLVYEISTAIDARDANRLAGVYHWTGMSGSAGYQVWSRLDTIARRPLVDIVPVMPSLPPTPPVAPESARSTTFGDAAAAPSPTPSPAEATPVDPNLYPQVSVRRSPVALRVEQTLNDSATPSRTVFGLVRHFGCWWVRL